MTSQQDIQQALLGSWSLLDFRSQLEHGGERFPMGERARGIINYCANGRMSVHLQPAVNKKVKESVYDYVSYTGRYWVYVQPDGNVIAKHHLEVCSWPEEEGSFQTRKIELSGNQLTLLSPEPMNLEGVNQTIIVVGNINGIELDQSQEFMVRRDNKTPKFLAEYPMGKVPAFQGADGLKGFKCDAPAQHIVECGPHVPGLLGHGVTQRAVIRQWICMANNECVLPVFPLGTPGSVAIRPRGFRSKARDHPHGET